MKQLTTDFGYAVANNQSSLSAGKFGPLLLQDFILLEKLAHQNRERVAERTVHAKGSGAFGELVITNDISKYTKAACLQKGAKTKMLARFSTVAGEIGAADAERDVRGFALKFYTNEGNWDIVGNNTPVFFLRDPMKFPDFIHSQKRDPRTNLRSNEAAWDFWSLVPESMHQVMILMSDRGIPASYRNMHGFGSHTYSFINAKNERFWVKFHFKTAQGIKNLTNAEAEKIIGKDRESHGRDLFEAIERGEYPRWNFKIQIMSENEAKTCGFNPFDLTKTWSQKAYPLIDVGYFELNKNPQNYFNEIEQAAFSPSNIVPGVGISPDRMLQARTFSYPDAQRYRIGSNYAQLPVNRTISEVNTYAAAGNMNFGAINGVKGEIYYEPNSKGGAVQNPAFLEPDLEISGVANRFDFDDFDYYSQPKALFDLMNETQKTALCENIAASMDGVSQTTMQRAFSHFEKISPELLSGVKKALKI